MSVEEIKREIASLSADDKKQVADFLSKLGQEESLDADLSAFLLGRLAQVQAGDFSPRSVSDIWQEVRTAR